MKKLRTFFIVIFAWFAFPVAAEPATPTRIPIQNAITKLIKEIDVPAEATGVLTEVMVREGDRVKKGQVLARVHDHKVRLEVKRFQIEQATARLQYANELAVRDAELAAAVAENELSRVLAANTRTPNTYRTGEVDRYQLLADRSNLQVQQAKHERTLRRLDELLAVNRLESASDTLSHYEIKAPWDGLVIAVNASAGKWVDPGSEIVRMIDPTYLRIEGFVSSDFAVDELVGAVAEVEFGRPGTEPQRIAGKVVFVSPDVNPVNFQARTFIEVENRNGLLRPGWTVQAYILPDAKKLPSKQRKTEQNNGSP